MDQLIKMVSDKAGISPEQAQTAVHHVMEFVKDKVPGGLGSHLEGLLSGSGSGGLGDIASKLGGLLGGKGEGK